MKTAKTIAAMLALALASVAGAAWYSTGGEQGKPEVRVLTQDAGGTTFEVTVPGIEVSRVERDGAEYAQLALPGEVFAVLGEGRPEVPKVSVLLGIPTGARVSMRVLDYETRTLAVGSVLPQQPPLLDGEEAGTLVLDREFYSRDESWPSSRCRLVETGQWRDLGVVNLQVLPVRVNPSKGEVEVATRVRVRVDCSGGSYPREVADWMLPNYAEYLDNYRELGLRPMTDYTPGVRYLVFCHQNWASHALLHDTLLGWVHRRGYEMREIVKPSFTAQEIKDSIRAEYERHTPALLEYVLLVGEQTEIPTGTYSGVGISDYWYKDIQPWPAGDNYPEVKLARLSPTSGTDLDNQVRKVVKYQKNPAGSDWLEKMTYVAHSEQYPGKYSACVRGCYNMPKPYWQPQQETIMGQFTGNASVTSAVNAGTGYVIYRGHGDATEWWSWGTEGSWYNSHVAALANGDLTPATFHWACICGDISVGECHTEAWMRKYPGGAASALGATQASYTYPNHGQCSTVVRAVCDTWTITVPGVRDYVGPTFSVSGIENYMDAYVAKYWPSSPYPDNLYMYLTLGDPAMPAWSGGTPLMADVSYPGVIPIGPYDLVVSVSVGGQPVGGALVCAKKDGDFYTVERTNASGVATLAVNPGSPGEVQLTVSEGHAMSAAHTPILPHEGTIIAQTGGIPYVTYLRHAINDSPPGGNGDGSVNPGETIIIPTWVKNHGDSTARSLVGRLRTTDGYITLLDTVKAFGDVAPHDSAFTGADGYEFTVAPACTNGHLVRFELACNDANDSVWRSNLYVRVGAPNLAYHSYGVIDTISGGNGNGRIDPNESAELMVTLRNVGFGNAGGVTAVLVSGDARLAVVDSFGDFGLIPPDSMATNTADRFVVHAGAMPPETELPCTLHVFAAGGYTKTLAFSLMVGEIRSVDPVPDNATPTLYWAYDDCDTFYTEAPTFEWVDITGVGTRTAITSDDQTVQVTLPTAFGPFVFYGRSFSQLSVCGNGWVGPGYTTRTAYSNVAIPATNQSTMLALVWDDLYPPTSNGVWYYHDEANHRFIVQYDSMPYYSSRTTFDWFQVVIYDTTMAAEDGNSVFTYQYLTANGYNSCTVGSNDSTTGTGIQCLLDGTYHRGSAAIGAGRAVKFTTDGPIVGISEPGSEIGSVPRALQLSVAPNPFKRASTLRWQLPVPGRVRLGVFDISGRSVRTLVNADVKAGSYTSAWDGRDEQGRQVANGTYLYQLETPAGVRTTKAVLLR